MMRSLTLLFIDLDDKLFQDKEDYMFEWDILNQQSCYQPKLFKHYPTPQPTAHPG